MHETDNGYNGQEIAVIGLSIRVNRAKNIEEFWDNLEKGIELVSLLSDEELLAAGENPAALKNSNYVRAVSTLEDREYFDAPFFAYSMNVPGKP
jgi:acyl transferase domain-containing protein